MRKISKRLLTVRKMSINPSCSDVFLIFVDIIRMGLSILCFKGSHLKISY